MHEYLANDEVMTWALCLSVYLMFCARCWRDMMPGQARRKRRGGNWTLGSLLLMPVLFPVVAPSIVTVALIRTLQARGLRARKFP